MRRSGVSIRGFQAPRVRPQENASNSSSGISTTAPAGTTTTSNTLSKEHGKNTTAPQPTSAVIVPAATPSTPSASPDVTESHAQAAKPSRSQTRKRSRPSDTSTTNSASKAKDTASLISSSSAVVGGPLRGRQSHEAAHRKVYYPPVKVTSTAALSTSTVHVAGSSLAMSSTELGWYEGPRGEVEEGMKAYNTSEGYNDEPPLQKTHTEHVIRSTERAFGVQDTVVWPANVQANNYTSSVTHNATEEENTRQENVQATSNGNTHAASNTAAASCGGSDFLRALEFALTQPPTPPLPSQLPLNEMFQATLTSSSPSGSPSQMMRRTMSEPTPPSQYNNNNNAPLSPSPSNTTTRNRQVTTKKVVKTPETHVVLSALSAPETARALVFSAATQQTGIEDRANDAESHALRLLQGQSEQRSSTPELQESARVQDEENNKSPAIHTKYNEPLVVQEEEEQNKESDEALAREVAEEKRMAEDLPFTPNDASCEATRERVGIFLSQSSLHARMSEAHDGVADPPLPTSQQLNDMVAVMLTPHNHTNNNEEEGEEGEDSESQTKGYNLSPKTTKDITAVYCNSNATPSCSQSTRTQQAMQRVRKAARTSNACTPDYLRALERAQRESIGTPYGSSGLFFGLSQPPSPNKEDNENEVVEGEEGKEAERENVEDNARMEQNSTAVTNETTAAAEVRSAIATGMVLMTGTAHQNRTTFRLITKQQPHQRDEEAKMQPAVAVEDEKVTAPSAAVPGEGVEEENTVEPHAAAHDITIIPNEAPLLTNDENSREVMDERSNSGPPPTGTTTTARPKRTCFVLTRSALTVAVAPAIDTKDEVHTVKETVTDLPTKDEAVVESNTVAAHNEEDVVKPFLAEETHSAVVDKPVEAPPAPSTVATLSVPMTVMNDIGSMPAASPSPSIQPPNTTTTTTTGVVNNIDEDGGMVPNTFYDLPLSVAELFARLRGVRTLYDWQHHVLTRADVRRGANFIYSLPTSGGKTLVAEILLLRCILLRRRSCFFVLPFVSLAEEKTTALQPFGDALGFSVDGHYGMTGRFPLARTGPTLYVCTIEKANSVLNHLLEENAADELGAVVVDELHMLGESRRGATLELFLSKLLLLHTARNTAEQQSDATKISSTVSPLQLIGMSATVSNLPALAAWLQAAYYESHHRPVPLRQYSVVEGMVLRDGEVNERNLSGGNDLERLFELITEVPTASVLVFCASRQQCVDTARGVVRYLQLRTASSAALAVQDYTSAANISSSSDKNSTSSSSSSHQALQTLLTEAAAAAAMPATTLAQLRALPPHAASAIEALLSDLYSSSHAEAGQLAEVVPYGVAFHHGGLLAEEREWIERAYRNKHLRILCCTSTLAAGVNLPARRVIFKTPYIGRDFLTRARYLQMAGRAGRAGLDPYGESFLLLSRRDRAKGHRLMHERLEPCSSQMLEDAGSFSRALLECVGVRLVSSVPAAQRWGCIALLGRYAPGPIDITLQHLLTPHQQQQQQKEQKEEDTNSSVQPMSQEKTMQICLQHTLTQLVQCGLVRQELMCPELPTAPNDSHTSPTEKDNMDNNKEDAVDDIVPVMRLEVTPFGASAVRSCFSVEEAVVVRAEFDQLRQTGLILADDLHLCYFLTPLREVGNCDWELFRILLSRLNDTRQYIASLIGVDEYFVDQRAMGLGGGSAHAVPTSEEGKRKFFVARRFYVALMLADVLSEVPMHEIEARYNVSRGQLQSLMRSASLFSSSITSFCHAMEWYSLEAVLASFVKRLDFGVKPDLVPLMEIHGVQPARARALWLAGFRDPTSIATCTSAEDMVARVKKQNPPDSKVAKFFSVRSATRLIREATALLQNQIRTRRGELQALATRVSHAPEEPGMPL